LYDERICRDRQHAVRILADPARRQGRGPGCSPADGRKGGKDVIAAITGGDNDKAMPPRTVLIIAFDGVQSLDITGPLEVFTVASRGQAGRGAGSPAYQVRVASLGGAPVRTSSGLTLVPDTDLRAAADVHTLVVPGGEGAQSPAPELIGWIRLHAPGLARITAVCTGAFLLAEAGLLTGRRVTTHWSAADALARRFPEVQVDPEPIYIRDGNIVTSAGVTAGIDLCLTLVEEDLGRDAALEVARQLVVFLRRPGNQAQFSAQLRAQVAQRRPLREVQQWITERPAADLSVDSLATRAGLSPRQFARTFAAETGMTPGQYVGKVRLEAARRLLEDTGDGIEQVARRCGYRTAEAMRRAFVRTLGVSPAGYRHRF
jgi:transcriptional regulator GlxA family with amidase domain